MDDARKAARAGATEGWAVVAEAMTKGRGTLDHAWHAPVGGLYTSFILREPGDVRLLTLALGVAVCDVLEVAGVDAQLKWVNDVYVGGRKVAGILVESEATGSRIDFLVCGIGINVNGKRASFPKPLAETATTVEEELACEQCIPDLETLLWERVAARVEQLRIGEGASVLAAFAQRDFLQGKRVRVDQGGEVAQGIASGLDGQGRLRLQHGTELVLVSGGSVTML